MLGKSTSGTGLPRNSHKGSHPCSSLKINSRSGGVTPFTSSLCAKYPALAFCRHSSKYLGSFMHHASRLRSMWKTYRVARSSTRAIGPTKVLSIFSTKGTTGLLVALMTVLQKLSYHLSRSRSTRTTFASGYAVTSSFAKTAAGWSVQAATWPSRLSKVLRSKGRGFCLFASNFDSKASAHMAISSGFSAIFTQW